MRPATTKERPTLLATPWRRDASHATKHELHPAGHAVKHELHPAGQALPCQSQRSGGGAVPISAGGVGWLGFVWLVIFGCWEISFVVVFGCWEISFVICGGFWLQRKKILWWFLVALVDLRWLWWWRGGKDYGSWLFLVGNNNTEK